MRNFLEELTEPGPDAFNNCSYLKKTLIFIQQDGLKLQWVFDKTIY